MLLSSTCNGSNALFPPFLDSLMLSLSILSSSSSSLLVSYTAPPSLVSMDDPMTLRVSPDDSTLDSSFLLLLFNIIELVYLCDSADGPSLGSYVILYCKALFNFKRSFSRN